MRASSSGRREPPWVGVKSSSMRNLLVSPMAERSRSRRTLFSALAKWSVARSPALEKLRKNSRGLVTL
jgi:hypothetical protein